MSGLLAACAELLKRFAGLNFAEAVWWRVGAAKAAGEDLNYLGVGGLYIAGGQGIIIIAICQVLPSTPSGRPPEVEALQHAHARWWVARCPDAGSRTSPWGQHAW